MRGEGDDEVYGVRIRFAAEAGEDIGIDRLVMLLTDSASIRDVILRLRLKD